MLLDWLLGLLAGMASIVNLAAHPAQADVSFPFFYFILIGPNLNSEQLNVDNWKLIIWPWPQPDHCVTYHCHYWNQCKERILSMCLVSHLVPVDNDHPFLISFQWPLHWPKSCRRAFAAMPLWPAVLLMTRWARRVIQVFQKHFFSQGWAHC